MAREIISAWRFDFSDQKSLLESLYVQAKAEKWGLSRECFSEALRRSAEKRFQGKSVDASEVENYLKSLHLEDLALACACSEGIEAAWEFFIAHFKRALREASRAILRTSGPAGDADADELADSLYVELYGIRSTESDRRKSLFVYFHGRSKLSTWLRTVLAQRHIDLLRTRRETIPLDGDTDPLPLGPMPVAVATPHDPDRAKYLPMIDRALSMALACLTPRERMLLSCYYIDQSTLAEIGRVVGEHESTVSRQLERTWQTLRASVIEILRRGAPAQDGYSAQPGLDDSQIEVAFACALQDWPFDLTRALSSAEAAVNPAQNSSRQVRKSMQDTKTGPF